MNKFYVLIGIPGSGKTTYRNEFNKDNKIICVSTDDVRQKNKGIDEKMVWPLVYKTIGENLKNGFDVIFDATSTTKKVRDRLINEVNAYYENYELIGLYFPTSYRVCMNRVKKRNEDPNELFLPLDVIESYGNNIYPPTYEEKFDKALVISNVDWFIKGAVNDSYQGYSLYFKEKDYIMLEHSGFSNINNFTPVRENTNFRLASVSKEFIAYGILTLVYKGLLKLDDTLFDIFDNMPLYTKNIKIHNLLCHTSGIYNYEDMPHTEKQVLDNDVLDYIRTTNDTYFEIGSKYQYSNTAYVLLGLIIEKISGTRLGDYMKENVFDKAGLTDTCVDYENETQINNRAYGNIVIDNKLVMKDQYWCSATIGDGGIYSNILDLIKWIEFVRNINEYPYTLLKETNIINGNDIEYGYGLRVKNVYGHKLIYHCGDTIGTNTLIGYVEDLDIEFAFLTNKGKTNTEILISNLRDYIKEK